MTRPPTFTTVVSQAWGGVELFVLIRLSARALGEGARAETRLEPSLRRAPKVTRVSWVYSASARRPVVRIPRHRALVGVGTRRAVCRVCGGVCCKRAEFQRSRRSVLGDCRSAYDCRHAGSSAPAVRCPPACPGAGQGLQPRRVRFDGHDGGAYDCRALHRVGRSSPD